MAVVSCNPVCVLDDTDNEDRSRAYSVAWIAITDSVYDTPRTIKTHPSFPFRGQCFSFGNDVDASALMVGSRVQLKEKDGSRLIWDCTVNYLATPSGLGQPTPLDSNPDGNPLKEPAVVECISTKGRKAFLRDTEGRLVCSSAGEPYDPVQERDNTLYSIRTTRNQSRVFPSLYVQYKDTTNLTEYLGMKPDCVKCEVPGTWQQLYYGNQPYYRVTWEFSLDDDDYLYKLYDYGMHRLVDGELVVLKDRAGVPLQAPRLLDGKTGTPIAIGQPPVQIDPPFKGYKRAAYQNLNLTELNGF